MEFKGVNREEAIKIREMYKGLTDDQQVKWLIENREKWVLGYDSYGCSHPANLIPEEDDDIELTEEYIATWREKYKYEVEEGISAWALDLGDIGASQILEELGFNLQYW